MQTIVGPTRTTTLAMTLVGFRLKFGAKLVSRVLGSNETVNGQLPHALGAAVSALLSSLLPVSVG
jgi:hypothetical protein